MLYTSYFAMAKKLPTNVEPISISVYPPKGFNGLEYKKLAPSKAILYQYKNNQDETMYRNEYLKQLSKLNPHHVVEELKQLSGKDICLLCYEKSGSFCHRNIVAEWLREAGYEISEYIYK